MSPNVQWNVSTQIVLRKQAVKALLGIKLLGEKGKPT